MSTYAGRTAEQTAVLYIDQLGGAAAIALFKRHLATNQRLARRARTPAIREEYDRLQAWYGDVLRHMEPEV